MATTNENGTTTGLANGSEAPQKKRAKTSLFSEVNGVVDHDNFALDQEQELSEQYANSKPYHHARLVDLFDKDFLTSAKEQIKINSKVNFKETDLFRVFQSIDLANLEPNTELVDKMPSVMKLREILYSDEWRAFMERVTKLAPGTLSAQVDCAANCHAPGCHLLTHDDVIGTRKISYIIYLTEPEWKVEEGGALELYDSHPVETAGENNKTDENNKQDASRREPATCPSVSVLPIFNSMAFFVVEPGVSFHSVQEVMGERPRLSIQGWYHAAKAPDHIENATLNRLKEDTQNDLDEDPFVPFKEDRVQPLEIQRKQKAANADKLSDADRDYLAQYINETYLTKTSMEEIREKFEEDSSVQLKHFFRKSYRQQIDAATGQLDKQARPPLVEGPVPADKDKNYYLWGATDEWQLVGPAHKQRFLEYKRPSDDGGAAPLALVSSPPCVGDTLTQLKENVMQSAAFARYLNYVTSLGVPKGFKGKVRRFRPGLDYTVAHYGVLTQTPVLDATVCFVAGKGGTAPPIMEEDSKEGKSKSEEADKSNKAGAKDGHESDVLLDDFDEADALWQSDDYGAFECYIEADGFDKAGSAVDEAADEYNEEDDTNLLSVSASNNTLSLVYRDPGTMRFVKYVGSKAPSSRWDISMEYEVPHDEDSEGNEVS